MGGHANDESLARMDPIEWDLMDKEGGGDANAIDVDIDINLDNDDEKTREEKAGSPFDCRLDVGFHEGTGEQGASVIPSATTPDSSSPDDISRENAERSMAPWELLWKR